MPLIERRSDASTVGSSSARDLSARTIRRGHFRAGAAAIAAAGCGLLILHGCANAYLLDQGFPLDDAWIHAVYARELARTGTLAYNPGIAATGETSPLWALVVAPAHWVSTDWQRTVTLTKAIGFGFHLLTVAVLVSTLTSLVETRTRILCAGSAALVGIHPHLVAASVSGMEVPLATFVVALAFRATVMNRAVLLAVVGAVSVVARPEVLLVVVALPVVFWTAKSRFRAMKLSAAGTAGVFVSLTALGLRNYLVSGLPLPATFYAKAKTSSLFDPSSQVMGFGNLLDRIPEIGPWPIVVMLTVLAVVIVRRRDTSAGSLAAATMYLVGVVFCAAAFSLIPPIDADAFYHQRYVLPALPLLLASAPLLCAELLSPIFSKDARAAATALAAVLVVYLVAVSPVRYRRLANDARNVDDVQVALGRALANASSSETAWVIDAGASRFFGRPFVVDMIGLNTHQLLRSDAQTYLDAHRPDYLDEFSGWLSIRSSTSFQSRREFESSTPYSVTSFRHMRRHVLVDCLPPRTTGQIFVRGRSFRFECAP
jgi:hypothetical protein